MAFLQYCLSSNAYKNNIFTGFSQLQKQEEFVDLTLAADGCIVKVHRNIIALASPYLKEILKSMSSYSPVIYLNNVSQKVLSYLLEYIYHGEVTIPADSVDAFVEVSKSLHIAGIEDLEPPKMKSRSKLTAKKKKPPERRASNIATQITIGSDNLLQVQQYPPSDNSGNNDNYETDYSIEEQHQSIRQQNQANIRNDAKFIIHQNENGINLSIDQQNQEPLDRETLQNIPVIEIQSDRMAEMHTTGNFLHNNLQSQTDDTITKQHNFKNTLDNIDGFQITTDNLKAEQQVQTNKAQLNDYKIIVKTQNGTGGQAAETEALQSNMPVIEIQHIGFADQQEPNVTLQDQNSILPIQIDTETQPFQDNAILPIQTGTTQDQNNLAMPQITRPIIKILDNRIIKSTVNSSGMDVGQQSQLGDKEVSILPADYKANINDLKGMSMFSISERGALQLILNRFMYCSHHSSRTKRRWRCVDYRRGACRALVDTDNGAIIARKGVHNHSFHDSKIYKKHQKGLIYHTIEQAVASRDSKQKEGLRMVLDEESP